MIKRLLSDHASVNIPVLLREVIMLACLDFMLYLAPDSRLKRHEQDAYRVDKCVAPSEENFRVSAIEMQCLLYFFEDE